MKFLIITGPPYSGKGTQCEILKQELGYKHISTGDVCRSEKMSGTEIGKIMSQYEEKGDLVPDSIMKKMFGQIIDTNLSQKGIILDGYPRTIAQVDDLLDLLDSKGLIVSKIINIDVPKDELLARALNRAATSDRVDDRDPAVHLKRIEVFEALTRPAIEYLKSRMEVLTFSGLGNVDEITAQIKSGL